MTFESKLSDTPLACRVLEAHPPLKEALKELLEAQKKTLKGVWDMCKSQRLVTDKQYKKGWSVRDMDTDTFHDDMCDAMLRAIGHDSEEHIQYLQDLQNKETKEGLRNENLKLRAEIANMKRAASEAASEKDAAIRKKEERSLEYYNHYKVFMNGSDNDIASAGEVVGLLVQELEAKGRKIEELQAQVGELLRAGAEHRPPSSERALEGAGVPPADQSAGVAAEPRGRGSVHESSSDDFDCAC